MLTLGLVAALGRGVVLTVDTDGPELDRIADQERAVVTMLGERDSTREGRDLPY